MSDLFLSDDPPPRRSRPRWVDGLGLGAVVLGIVAVGVLGDRGSSDRTPAPTTTTSTTSPFRRGTPYQQTTTTRPLPTTTTGPQLVPRVVPEETDTWLLLAAEGHWRLLDVDLGQLRNISVPAGYSTIGTRAGLLVAAPEELRFVRPGDPTTSIVRSLPDREHTLVAVGLDHAWLTAQEGVDVVTGQLDAQGRDTGRLIELPPQAQVVAGLADGVVVSQAGALTVVPTHGRPRALGTGTVLGAAGPFVVRSTCVALKCRLEVVDTRTGAARAVTGAPEPQAGIGGRGATSSDGRWLVTVTFDAHTGYGDLIAIELDTGRARVLSTGVNGQVAFATTGDWVFSVEQGRLRAYDVRTGDRHELAVDVSGVVDLVATPAP